ncbi:MAG: DNA recombination protein RmuC, partial [Gemmatimonadales bacterium]
LPVLADLRERLGHLSEATRHLRDVGETVADVQDLLRVPKLRGTLGEVWLEQLLHQVIPGAYEMQHTFRSGERVDAVVRLGDRIVPVDAKFPLEACRRMLAASGDGAERERRVFERSLRARIDEIADKYIRPDEGTYEFALMYVPAENVYHEAIARGTDADGVLAHAMRRRVIPVSPHTFYAYLLVILHGLKGMRVEARARELLGELGTLRQQFDAFWASFEKVGTHLANAGKQYAESERHAGRVRERVERVVEGGGAAADAGGEARREG